ncbi:MAG: hypothetical protein AVDCRST_MAG34-2758 [uncultured Nocardioidaceae bacterium]|uniref:DUF4229 domain-containing protein n=1 Tax=uncultured Nocardioidaceae bacterium TaxID=253824 RepID=A0A6J4MMW2_9ACTN|nr:MAG: hypothetical protein AVDCRST_MAG34-2758 [uncultured Nocardioidaceae bacterium]
MKHFLAYTGARLGLFLLTYAVIIGGYLLLGGGTPVPLFWPLLLAALVSGVVSAYALRGLRQRFSAVVEQRADRMSRRFEEMKAKEDVD